MNKDDLIKGLNEDLAAELGTVIRYTYESAMASGLMGEELRDILEDEIEDELGHASYLMDVIIDMGGDPTTTPAPFKKLGTMKELMQQDLEMEEADVKNYQAHAEMADKLGLVELKIKLEEMAADEAGHARVIRRLLRGM